MIQELRHPSWYLMSYVLPLFLHVKDFVVFITEHVTHFFLSHLRQPFSGGGWPSPGNGSALNRDLTNSNLKFGGCLKTTLGLLGKTVGENERCY